MRQVNHHFRDKMMTPAEVEFLAEKQTITIVPNFTHDKVYLIAGDIGPFRASIPVPVPLWLAVNLRQRQKCRIVPPEWMDVEKLEEKKEEEMREKLFTQMPDPHFMEVTQLVLSCATPDIPRADEIRTLVKDIWDLRISKLRNSMDAFVQSDGTHAKLDHLTVMEINSVRSFLTATMDHLHSLRQNLTAATMRNSQD